MGCWWQYYNCSKSDFLALTKITCFRLTTPVSYPELILAALEWNLCTIIRDVCNTRTICGNDHPGNIVCSSQSQYCGQLEASQANLLSLLWHKLQQPFSFLWQPSTFLKALHPSNKLCGRGYTRKIREILVNERPPHILI